MSISSARNNVKNQHACPVGGNRRSVLLPRRPGELRRALIAGTVLLGVLSAAIVLAVNTGLPSLFTSGSSRQTPSSSVAAEARTGTIVFQHGPNRCRQLLFDNDNGRSVEKVGRCDQEVISEKGELVPWGTVHRLDAISKSFKKP